MSSSPVCLEENSGGRFSKPGRSADTELAGIRDLYGLHESRCRVAFENLPMLLGKHYLETDGLLGPGSRMYIPSNLVPCRIHLWKEGPHLRSGYNARL